MQTLCKPCVRACVRGRAGTADDVKAQLLGLLLYLDTDDLAREWRRRPQQLPPGLREGPHPALQVRRRVCGVFFLGGGGRGVDGG